MVDETLSRVDRSFTKIVYDIWLDQRRELVERVTITVLTAARQQGDTRSVDPREVLTTQEHIAFTSEYRYFDFAAVEKFDVPSAAAAFLR